MFFFINIFHMCGPPLRSNWTPSRGGSIPDFLRKPYNSQLLFSREGGLDPLTPPTLSVSPHCIRLFKWLVFACLFFCYCCCPCFFFFGGGGLGGGYILVLWDLWIYTMLPITTPHREALSHYSKFILPLESVSLMHMHAVHSNLDTVHCCKCQKVKFAGTFRTKILLCRSLHESISKENQVL